MSTLQVTDVQASTVKNPNTTNGGVAIDATGHVQVDGLQMPTVGPLSNRNLIINGGMQVNQRSTSTSFTASANGFVVDRFHNFIGHGAFTVSQSTDAPSGFANSLKWDCTTSASSGSSGETFVEQKIEAQNLQNLAYGTSSAKSFILSFWVKSNLTGNFGFWIENNDATRYYASAGYTINSANTWEYKTITVPGDTAGTGLNNDNGIGFKLRFYLVSNSTMQGTPAESWETSPTIRTSSSMVNLASSTDNEFFLTGVQLEVGEKATPFEHRSFGDEMVRCERYYQKSYEYVTAPGAATRKGAVGFICSNSSNGEQAQLRFQSRMRNEPTFKMYNPVTGAIDSVRNYGNSTNQTPAYNEISQTGFTGGTAAPSDGDLFFFHFTADAEL